MPRSWGSKRKCANFLALRKVLCYLSFHALQITQQETKMQTHPQLPRFQPPTVADEGEEATSYDVEDVLMAAKCCSYAVTPVQVQQHLKDIERMVLDMLCQARIEGAHGQMARDAQRRGVRA